MTAVRSLAIFLAVLVAGCQSGPRLTIEQRLAAYQGWSEQQLVNDMGPPDNVYVLDGTRYLSWYTQKTRYRPGFGGYFGDRNGLFIGPSYGGYAYSVSCKTTFLVKRSKVVGFDLQGNGCPR
ncbi:hypothetical protein HDIA_4473 [Hartmannibacter diazotrophicus]|uniref:Lipoprotein n=1 Tax=Hartmannibacter diazotrophicus TaxID=1482074 RepID=A0A2C9DCG7_9HYPH|nr:hypothetical protein [Hartmannibacter diazotrophicus]SON58014.1 hypothetical protein HDIA_4473 [Hartmannibacter diazotrophicus]